MFRVLLRIFLGFAILAGAAPLRAEGLSIGGQNVAGDIPQDGLLLWLDASDTGTLEVHDGRVAAWHSKGGAPGASGTRLMAEGKARPRYIADPGGALPAMVRFDGIDDVLRALDFNQASGEYTLLLVLAPSSGKGMGGMISACPAKGNDYDPGFNVDLYESGGEFQSINIEGAGRLAGQLDLLTSSHAYGGLHTIAVVRECERLRVRLDGRVEGERPMGAAPTNMQELRLGARFYDAQERQFYHGDIAQVFLYAKALTMQEIEQLEKRNAICEGVRKLGEDRLANEPLQIQTFPHKTIRRWATVAAWQASPEGQVPVAGDTALVADQGSAITGLPIRTDVREALELSVQFLNSLFDKDRDNEPYFYSNCTINGTGKMLHSANIGIPHVVGRSLLGSLIAEDLAGIQPPPEGIEILERYCRQSFDNPDHLNSYFDPERGNQRFIELHNMREGLYGLVFLYKMRHRDWAREKADLMIQALASFTDENGLWSEDLARRTGLDARLEGMMVLNASRVIDPLLAWHRLTGNQEALRLAGLYARQGLANGFEADGRIRKMKWSSGHVHTIMSSLSGITDYAILAGDREMLEACRRVIQNGVPEYFSAWGWGDEVIPEHPANVVGRGEMNQTADVIRTALLLAEAVDPAYYDLAERFMRSMVLPTQQREPELRRFMKEPESPMDDSETNVIRRTIGGFAMQLPNDRMMDGDWPLATQDITSGSAHAMSEFIRHMLVTTSDTTTLNLLFSCRDQAFEIRSGLPLDGRVAFLSNGGSTLRLRIPGYVDRGSLKLVLGREPAEVTIDGDYVIVAGLKAGHQGELTFDVPCRMERQMVDGTEYTSKWVGDQVVQIEPRGTVSPLPF